MCPEDAIASDKCVVKTEAITHTLSETCSFVYKFHLKCLWTYSEDFGLGRRLFKSNSRLGSVMSIKARNNNAHKGQNPLSLPGKLLVCLKFCVFKTRTKASAHINISSFNIKKQGKHFKAAQSRPKLDFHVEYIFLKSLLLCGRKYI